MMQRAKFKTDRVGVRKAIDSGAAVCPTSTFVIAPNSGHPAVLDDFVLGLIPATWAGSRNGNSLDDDFSPLGS